VADLLDVGNAPGLPLSSAGGCAVRGSGKSEPAHT
jgi:hypothetical protein